MDSLLHFRPATLDDLADLKRLEQAVVDAERPFNPVIKPTNATYYDLPYLITNEHSLLLVALQEQQIVATGYLDIRQSKASLNHAKHGYLGFMYVVPELRGKGINQQLMQQLINWAKERDITHFYLDVYAENSAALSAYKKLGFTPNLLEMRLDLA